MIVRWTACVCERALEKTHTHVVNIVSNKDRRWRTRRVKFQEIRSREYRGGGGGAGDGRG